MSELSEQKTASGREHTRSKVTRADRAIYDDAWIKDFLRRAGMITLATAREGQPYQSTLLFVYEEARHAIYLHTSRRGGVYHAGTASGSLPVCLTSTEMGRLLPAPTALNFSVEYQSVVVFGSMRPVEDPTEAQCALQMLLDKYFTHLHSGEDYRPITPEELAITAVFRVDVEEWSGKRKAVAEDFPGAFRWGEK
jgi:nitroimidazol reductase NimA-like FMN-containing flavoprotein (pyridoxamine 5'-phosphate oxidase superfamily)